MLLPTERDQLVFEVANLTNSDPEPLKIIIGSQHVIQIDTHKRPSVYAHYVVRYCERSAWIEDPALIIRMLNLFSFSNGALNQALVRLKAKGPVRYFKGNRPWDTCLLALELPFLNRANTRQAVELFNNPLVPEDEYPPKEPGVRVLVVNGPPNTGKSFTHDYIRYINSFLGDKFRIAWIDRKKEISSRFSPDALVKSLLDQINPDWDETKLPKLDTAQAARWLTELVKFLGDHITATGEPWILILDGFDKPGVPKETVELIQKMAATAVGSESTEYNDSIRLALLGFNEAIPNYKGRVKADKTGPVLEKDIEKYFKDYAEYKDWPPFGAGVLAKIVEQVLKSSPPGDHPDHVKRVASNALRLAHSLDQSITRPIIQE